jgi:hypothetical protein
LQFLYVALKSAVTRNHDNRCVRVRKDLTQGRWQAGSHGSHPAGSEETLAGSRINRLGSLPLVLANIGHIVDGFASFR